MADKHEQKTENAEEREARGIPADMEKAESKGSPHDDRLKTETAHGKPEGRPPTGEGS